MQRGNLPQDKEHDRVLSSDNVWVWAGPGNDLGPSVYGLGETAAFFGAENVCAMWLPSTTQPSAALDTLKDFRRVIWDITCTRWQRRMCRVEGEDTDRVGFFSVDSWSLGRGHESKEEAGKIGRLSKTFPNIAGGIMDYSFGGFARRGGTPADLKEIQDALKAENPALELHWMNFTTDLDEKWADYLPYVDVISLWEPSPQNLENLDESVEKCARVFPGKPIVLGLFLVNYWARRMEPGETDEWQQHHEWALRPLTQETLQLQFETAARLLHEGRICGISILAEALLDKFPETVQWVREFLERNWR